MLGNYKNLLYSEKFDKGSRSSSSSNSSRSSSSNNNNNNNNNNRDISGSLPLLMRSGRLHNLHHGNMNYIKANYITIDFDFGIRL